MNFTVIADAAVGVSNTCATVQVTRTNTAKRKLMNAHQIHARDKATAPTCSMPSTALVLQVLTSSL